MTDFEKQYYASFIENAYSKQKEFENKFIKLRYGKIRSGYGSSEEEKDYLYNLSESEIEENRRRYDDELDNAVIKYKEKFGYTDMSKIEIEHIIKEIDLDDEFIENRLVK